MHTIRRKKADGTLPPQVDGDDTHESAALQNSLYSITGDEGTSASHPNDAAALNRLGIYLEKTAGVFTACSAGGVPAIQSSAFVDRLLPASVFSNHNNNNSGSHKAAAVSRLAAAVPQDGCEGGSCGTAKNAKHLMSAAGRGTELDKSSTLQCRVSRSAVYGEGTEPLSSSDGLQRPKTAMEHFFRRMSRELGSMVNLDVSELREHEAARSSSRASDVSSASTLNALVRVDAKKRETTNQLFSDLQRPFIRETVRTDTQKRLDVQQRKYHQQIDALVDPACALLEAVWDQYCVPRPIRSKFAEAYFVSPTLESFAAINRELKRFQKVPTTEMSLIRFITLRETYVARLKTLVDAPKLLHPAVEELAAEGMVADICNTILLIRHVSCLLIDTLQEQRRFQQQGSSDTDASSAHKSRLQGERKQLDNLKLQSEPHIRPNSRQDVTASSSSSQEEVVGRPLLWNGENYLLRMQTDLDFLAESKLSRLLGDGGSEYVLRRNPLILPVPLQTVRSSILQDVSRGKMTLRAALTKDVECSQLAELRQDVEKSRLGVGTSTADDDAVSFRAQHKTTLNRSGSALGINKKAENGLSNGRSKHPAKSGPIICIPVGVDVSAISNDARQDEVAVSVCASASLDGSAAARNTTREKFFQQLKKDELVQTRRIPMDRSNVYQYPESIYKEKPMPLWPYLSHVLQRSLDPRIASEIFDDSTDFEKLQYGNRTLPPVYFGHRRDTTINLETQCIRSILSPESLYTYDALMERDILLFAEEEHLKKANLRHRFHRAVGKLRIAYRGFISSLQRHQAIAKHNAAASASGSVAASSKEFLAWVKMHAPHWAEEAHKALQSNDDDLLLGMLDAP